MTVTVTVIVIVTVTVIVVDYSDEWYMREYIVKYYEMY